MASKLEDAPWPATKDELIDYAMRSGAPMEVVENLQVDYTGFVIPDKFVVGFGLDYDQRYRNLPYIGFVEDAD